MQSDWDQPRLETWHGAIVEAVEQSVRPVILVAHSLGVLAVAHAAPALRGKVRGGFLVAPPARPALAAIDSVDPAFAGPVGALAFPALLVASRDDPYASYEASENLAAILEADLVNAGNAGHINSESGYGPWPEGLMRFAAFLGSL
jgi:hypothetical protein